MAIVLLLSTCSSDTLLEPCLDRWNRDPPIETRANAINAIVWGSVNKAEQEGCTVVLTDGRGRPWVMYLTFLDPPGPWDTVRGARWGDDSPEGGPQVANARLLSSGRLVLA